MSIGKYLNREWFRRTLTVVLTVVVVGVAVSDCPGVRTRNSPEYLTYQPGAENPGEAYYESAMELFYDGLYLESRRKLQEMLDRYPDSQMAPEVRLKIAESSYLEGDLQNAAVFYQQLIDRYPQLPEAYEARVRLRQCMERGASGYKALMNENAVPDRLAAVMVPLLAGKDFSDVTREIERLSRMGFNAVILRVFHNEGQPYHGPADASQVSSGVYFRSSGAPLVYDLLPDIAQICHRYNLKLFAWMNTRDAVYGMDDNPDLMTWRYDPAGDALKVGSGLNLFHPEVENYLVGLYRDLATYDIDGILVGDDLLLRLDEGFSHQARKTYAELYSRSLDPALVLQGIDPTADQGADLSNLSRELWNFSKMKCERIVELQEALCRAVKEIRPTLPFGVSFNFLASSDLQKGMIYLAQDLSRSSEAGFNYYAVATYQKQIARQLSLDQKQLYQYINEVISRSKAIVGRPQRVLIQVQLVDWQTETYIEPREVQELLDLVLAKEPPSLALFPYRPDFPYEEIQGQLALLGTVSNNSITMEDSNVQSED